MLPYLISYMCLSVNPIYSSACPQALTATAMQIHLTQNLDLMQHNIETEIIKKTGKTVWGVGLMGYQLYIKNTLVFSTSIKPIADGLSVNLTTTTGNVGLSWSF